MLPKRLLLAALGLLLAGTGAAGGLARTAGQLQLDLGSLAGLDRHVLTRLALSAQPGDDRVVADRNFTERELALVVALDRRDDRDGLLGLGLLGLLALGLALRLGGGGMA